MAKKISKKDKIYNKMIIKIDSEVIKFFKSGRLSHLVIVVLFKGEKLPKYCTPMPRYPNPKVNIPLNNNLSEVYFSNIKNNPSIQDGAILIQIDHNPPILRGFSCRIYPPTLNLIRSKNMGSGYNSSLDFSGVERVMCVYYINRKGVKKFIRGKEKILC